MKRITMVFVVTCLGLLFVASTCFAQMYTVNDLGTLSSETSKGSVAIGINASGQVAGDSYVPSSGFPSFRERAFRTAPNLPINPLTDVLPVQGFAVSASGINDSGQVVGNTWVVGDDPGEFRTGDDSSNSLDCIPSHGLRSWVTAINNSGQAVGFGLAPEYWATSYRTGDKNNGTYCDGFDVGSFTPGGSAPGRTLATAINDMGQVVGWSVTGTKDVPWEGTRHAFRTAPNSSINPTTDDLGTLGGLQSNATDINAFGQVVGDSNINSLAYHAFRTAPNSPIDPPTDDLGTLGGSFSSASGINNFGEVVGWSSLTGDADQHAFLYDGGVMHDLNSLVPADSNCVLSGLRIYDGDSAPEGWSFRTVVAQINDAGQIAANCGGHAVRLDPIYKAFVQQPINADGSSVFSAKRGVIPIKFTLTQYNVQTCNLPTATIAITRATSDTLASVDESTFSTPADSGSYFRIDTNCQYVYNLAASSLGVGTYLVDISINGIMVGHAVFALK